MKNFKRLAIAAVVAVMAFGVTAFASTTTSSYDESDGKVKLADTTFMTAGTEYTVVLTAKDAEITDANILYINQGDKTASFWTGGMGPKTFDTAGEYELTINANGLTEAYVIPVTVEEDETITVGDVIELTGEYAGKVIKYAQAITVTDANSSATLSISDGETTKTYPETLATILDGEWVEGSSVSATLAVGIIIDADNDATFTVTVNSAN